jgi:hypothetical protein
VTINSNRENPELRRFEASRLWESNVYGAIAGGIGGGILMCVVAGIILSAGSGFDQASLVALALIANMMLGLLLLFPGNLAAAFPYAAEIEEGRGLRVFGPLKNLYIPFEDIKEVRRSFMVLGWVVKLNKRRGALTRITIHGGFGRQGGELARALQEEIARRGPPRPMNN